MTTGTFKALLSDRYQKMSAWIFKNEPNQALFAQEVATMLRDVRQPEMVILAGMAAASKDEEIINSLEVWEKEMVNDALAIIEHPEQFKEAKIKETDTELKTPSREASDIAAALLTVTLREQLERDIRNNESLSGPETFALPFYCYWDQKADIFYVSCRRSWRESLARFIAYLSSACPKLQITLSKTVKLTDCDWHIEPVHSYE